MKKGYKIVDDFKWWFCFDKEPNEIDLIDVIRIFYSIFIIVGILMGMMGLLK